MHATFAKRVFLLILHHVVPKNRISSDYHIKQEPPKANEPDAPTVPGYYLSYTIRLTFSKVEVISKKVYFKNRSVSGMSYEFRGTAGEEIDPEFDDTTPIPFIKDIMTKFKRGKIIKTEKIKFDRAVIL